MHRSAKKILEVSNPAICNQRRRPQLRGPVIDELGAAPAVGGKLSFDLDPSRTRESLERNFSRCGKAEASSRPAKSVFQAALMGYLRLPRDRRQKTPLGSSTPGRECEWARQLPT